MAYLFLSLAIVSEVIATTALNASQGLSRPLPIAVMVIGYGIAFVCLAMTLKTIPVGVAYAIWSGAGIVLIAVSGWMLYRQALDLPAIAGIGLIIAGITIMKFFSESSRL